MKNLTFICVNYHNIKLTIQLCDSLKAQKDTYSEFHINCIIVDNSSNDKQSIELIDYCTRNTSTSHKYKYSDPGKNLGYFGGLNFAIKGLDISDLDYLIIGNNDLQFDNSFCINLINNVYEPNVFVVCPDIVSRDGGHQNPHVLKQRDLIKINLLKLYFSNYYIARFMALLLKLFRPKKYLPLHDASEIFMGIGACYILMPSYLPNFKFLNYDSFLYSEEAYFSNQIHSAGGILWFDPSLRVSHFDNATLSLLPKRATYEYEKTSFWKSAWTLIDESK